MRPLPRLLLTDTALGVVALVATTTARYQAEPPAPALPNRDALEIQ
jgi:hypothetical protein